jgi:intergrase/recombinase
MCTKVKDIEMANKKNGTKKFYKDVQNLSRGPPSSLQICKDEAAKLLIEKEEILKIRKQYFEQMMKQDITHISQETEMTAQEHEENVKMISPTYKEISNIIDKLKSNKSPGPDNIIPGFIKYGDTSLKKRICCLICKIWENEILPDEWLKGIICPVLKKGDPKLCKNYRAITLLNVVYKVFSSYLHNKLSEIVENKISENQRVFRPNRSTIDNIHILRKIYEKSHE